MRWPPISNERLRRLRRPAWLGTLRRTSPLSDVFGLDRGKPVDRRYTEAFLDRHRQDIRGRVLEVKDSRYIDSRRGIGGGGGRSANPNFPVVVTVRAVKRAGRFPQS